MENEDLSVFATELYNISVSELNTADMNENNIDALSEKIIPIIPSKLYRFRSCTDYSFDALRKDEIWGSLLTELNDPMECMPCYNLERLTQMLHNDLSEAKLAKIINELKNNQFPQSVKNTISRKYRRQLKKKAIKEFSKTNLSQWSSNAKATIFQHINSILDKNIDSFFEQVFHFRKQVYLSCFAENLNSYLMWGHYANSHKGFAVEYNMKNYIKVCSKKCDTDKRCNFFHLNYQFAPAIYSESRYDASSYFSTIIMRDMINEMNNSKKLPFNLSYDLIKDIDLFRVPKTILTKSIEWNYEKEWRLFKFDESPKEKYDVLATDIKPVAIYLGSSISEKDRDTLLAICKDKKIDCCKMIMTYTSSSFSLHSLKIYDGSTDTMVTNS